MEQRWTKTLEKARNPETGKTGSVYILTAPCFGSNGVVETDGDESKGNGECLGCEDRCCVGAQNEVLPRQTKIVPD